MGPEKTSTRSGAVFVVLMKSDEADATISALESYQPDAIIEDHGTFWQIKAQDELVIDLKRVGEELGREIELGQWLTIMTTFVGRVSVEEGAFRITSEMLEFAPPSA
ncbi:MAG: MmoB/DmpM family protein [Candidatus Binataceae bacterium]|nr:MmoB/DmpM family protein [Candidatus Binataceae bacterium]